MNIVDQEIFNLRSEKEQEITYEGKGTTSRHWHQ
jgi:hypothetical protein